MDMQAVADILKELEVDNRIEPQAVVDKARSPDSPLYSFFEWDDTKAAAQHRLLQARQLIRRVKVEVIIRDVPMDVIKYVRDPDDVTGYRNIRMVNQEEMMRRVVDGEMAKVTKAAKRARSVAAVLGTVEDIDRIIGIANGLRRKPEVTDQPEGSA